MSKYIDADKLKAEIERRKGDYNASIEKYFDKKKFLEAERDSWRWAECKWFLSFIVSLQQEQPEVELNEEIIINEFRVIRDKCFNEGIEGWQREKLIARHFYELGLKARKEE